MAMCTRLARMDCSRSPTGMKVGTNMAVRRPSNLLSFCLSTVEISLTGTALVVSSTGAVILLSASLTWMKPRMLSSPLS